MNLLLKMLPLILVGIIFYVMNNYLYPKYQETIQLAKRFNELKNKEIELDNLQRLINSLNQNVTLRQLMGQTSTLDVWLPTEPKIEEIIYYLASGYQNFALSFPGADFKITENTQQFEEFILPRSAINFTLTAQLNSDKLNEFINYLEQSARLMIIKKAILSPLEPSKFEVETYFLPRKSK